MSNDEYDQTRMMKQADDAFLSFEHSSSFDSRYWNFVVPPAVLSWRLFFLTGTSSCSATSYSGLLTPINQWSNQPTMCCKRSTRCHGWPERESSCDSLGKRTITVGILRNFSARNICSPPAPGGVR